MRTLAFVACVLALAASVAQADVPRTMSYQGVLRDSGGSIVPDGYYSMTFTLYDAPGAVEGVWDETQTVQVTGGIFDVILGEGPTPLFLPFDQQYWLGITVPPDPELSPRVQLTAAPYALRAATVDACSDEDWLVNGLGQIYHLGSVGIGTSSPSAMLDVDGTVEATGLQMTTGPVAGHVLTSDGAGVGTWQPPGELTLPYEGGTSSPSPAFAVGNAGDGGAGLFVVDNPANGAPVVHAITNGTGRALIAAAVDSAVAVEVTGRVDATASHNPAAEFYADSLGCSDHVLAAVGGPGPVTMHAVYGDARPSEGNGTGGYFIGGREGVVGYVFPPGIYGGIGVQGYCSGGSGTNRGIYCYANGTGTNYAIHALAGASGTSYAGYFDGDVEVTGNFSWGTGKMRIDHPLEPGEKYLQHSVVQSPDMMDVYNGNVMLDSSGEAWVELPDWFEALNGDFRYQLTPIGAPAPGLYVARKISGNRFRIAGGEPGIEVSWMVTGIRRDACAEAQRVPVEQAKSYDERGRYLRPELYGRSADEAIHASAPAEPAEP